MKKIFKFIYYNIIDVINLGKGVKRNINNVSLRFPTKVSRYYESNYEAENFQFAQTNIKKGDTVLDLGAHIGLFSVAASQWVGQGGKIISCEPTNSTYQILKQTLQLNNCNNVIPLQYAISSTIGETTFYTDGNTEACNSNSLIKNNLTDKSKEQLVQTTTIDNLCKVNGLRPKFIKLDIEGFELEGLRGAKEVLLKEKPFWIIGIHPQFLKEKGDKIEEIYQLLKESGYKILLGNRPLSLSDCCNQKEFFDIHCVG